MLVFIFVFTVFVCFIVHDYVRKRGARWRHLSEFPGDTPLPLIGSALTLGFDSDEATKNIMKMWQRHGKRSFRLSVGSEDWVLLTEPDDISVLFGDNTILSKSPERNNAVKPFFGESVSTSEGERWRWARKLVLSTFHVKSLQQRLDVVNMKSERLIHILAEHGDKSPVPLYRYLRPFMLDILFNSLMGVDNNFMENLDHPYLVDSNKVIHMITENYFSYWRSIRPLFVLTPTYHEMKKIIKTIRDTATDVIARRRAKLNKTMEELEINNKSSTVGVQELFQKKISEENCLLDTLLIKKLPNGEPIPDDVINEEISFVYFTGHVTTAVTASHILYCLAENPDVQEKVIEEQRSIFKEDYLRKPTMHDLNEMKYLDTVFKETLRTIPTVPKIGRKLTKDLALNDGRIIPSGTTAIVYYEAIFSDEKVFPEPHKFKPDRFSEDNMHTHAFLPFGGGPRNCIGFRFATMAVKASLSNILRRFEVSPGGPGTEPVFSYRIVTESKNGIHLVFKKRN